MFKLFIIITFMVIYLFLLVGVFLLIKKRLSHLTHKQMKYVKIDGLLQNYNSILTTIAFLLIVLFLLGDITIILFF